LEKVLQQKQQHGDGTWAPSSPATLATINNLAGVLVS